MPIDVRHGPDLRQVAAVARATGAGLAARDDARFGAQLDQRDRHFYDQMQYGAVSDEMARDDADRRALLQDELLRSRQADADAARMEQTQSELQLRHEYGLAEEEEQAKREQQQEEFEYTTRQQRQRKEIQDALDKLPELRQQGWTDEQLSHAKYQLEAKQNGIVPTQPKQKLTDQFQKVKAVAEDGTEHEFFAVPGRNGGFDFKPANPLAPDPREASKQKIEAERLKDGREERVVDAAVKILSNHVGPDGKPTISAAEARKMAMELVGDVGGGGQSAATVVRSEAEAMALPPGTRFTLPNGRTGITAL